MKPTPEDLYDALYRIGREEDGPPISPAVLALLSELHIIEVQPDGQPTLTKFGWREFAKMESGDGEPVFEKLREPDPQDADHLLS